MCSYEEPFQYYQNFGVKKSIQKKIFTIYECVSPNEGHTSLVDDKYLFLYKCFDPQNMVQMLLTQKHLVPKNFMINKEFLNLRETIKVDRCEISFTTNSKMPF